MSQTHDTHDIETNTSADIAFAPLIDDDAEDFTSTKISSPDIYRARGRGRRIWLTALIVVVLLVLVGGGVFAYKQFTRPAPITYTQTAASVGNLSVTVSATGPVQANAVYDMNFSASGQIQAIYVHVGQQVKQGQKLATLSSTSLQDAVNQAQQSLNSANISVGTAESNLANTRNEESNAINIAYLNEQNALNACTSTSSGSGSGPGTPTPTPNPTAVANCQQLAQDQYNQAVAQANASINSSANQVTSAQQQVNSAQTGLQTAKDNLAAATLTAPHAGIIAAINGVVGQTAGSGGSSSSSSSSSSGSSAFIVLVDSSSLSIMAQVNEANIASVQVGQPAHFTIAAYPSLTFRATVSAIDTLGQTSSNVVTYPVSLAVDMQSLNNAHVYPGMTATLNITTAERIGTLLVPSSALSFSSTAIQNGELTRSQITSLISSSSASAGGSQGSRGIVVELKNGKLVPVLVTTGLTNGQFTEILSGLQEGDEVVTGQSGGQTTTTSTTTGGGGGGGGRFGGGGFGGGGFGGGGGNGG